MSQFKPLSASFNDVNIAWVATKGGRDYYPTGLLEVRGRAAAFMRDGTIIVLDASTVSPTTVFDYHKKDFREGRLIFKIAGHEFIVHRTRVDEMARNIVLYLEYYKNREAREPWSYQFSYGGEPSINLIVGYDVRGALAFLERLKIAGDVLQYPGKLEYAEGLLGFDPRVASPWSEFCRRDDSFMQKRVEADQRKAQGCCVVCGNKLPFLSRLLRKNAHSNCAAVTTAS